MTTHWNAFLPLGEFPDEPGLDPHWAAAMGVDKDALTVLRTVRREVLPLVRKMQSRKGVLRAWSFLVHDRASGVPCPPEDASAFIHLRLTLEDIPPFYRRSVKSIRPQLPDRWAYIKRVVPTDDELHVQATLHVQSEWYLKLVEDNAGMSDVDLLRHVGQTLHFYANMAQMAVR